jgi:hypothetical protein
MATKKTAEKVLYPCPMAKEDQVIKSIAQIFQIPGQMCGFVMFDGSRYLGNNIKDVFDVMMNTELMKRGVRFV